MADEREENFENFNFFGVIKSQTLSPHCTTWIIFTNHSHRNNKNNNVKNETFSEHYLFL